MKELTIENPNYLEIKEIGFDDIDKDRPFELDLFGRSKLAEEIYKIISKSNGLNLFLDADWGSGKSTFLKMSKVYFEKNGFQCIYFDAFSSDFQDDPFTAIAGEIISYYKEIDKTKKLDNFINSASKVLPKIADGTIKSLLKTIVNLKTFGTVDADDLIDKMMEGCSELYDNTVNYPFSVNDEAKSRLIEYADKKEAINTFKKALEELAGNEGSKLVFIVDELDRCRPDYSLEIIEKIKHFFNTKNVVFVLSSCKKYMNGIVNSVYNLNNEQYSERYLDKFIDYYFSFPKMNTNNIEVNKAYVKFMFEKIGAKNGLLINDFQEIIAKERSTYTLRDVEKFFKKFVLVSDIIKSKPSFQGDRDFYFPYIISIIIFHENKENNEISKILEANGQDLLKRIVNGYISLIYKSYINNRDSLKTNINSYIDKKFEDICNVVEIVLGDYSNRIGYKWKENN